MRRYFFNLKTNRGMVRDLEGLEFPDRSSAYEHAHVVARELMNNRALGTKSWRLDVCDGQGHSDFELLFAAANPSIAALAPETRAEVEAVCRREASLCDAINEIAMSVHQVRATIARSKGAPYLATLNGATL